MLTRQAGVYLLCGLDLVPVGLFENHFLPTFPTVEEGI